MEKVKVEKLVFGGQGLGQTLLGKKVFVWNALPGELIEAEFTKKRRGYAEGVGVNILNASKDRIEPVEEHFLSCSPWQILAFPAEDEWKINIAKETFKKIGDLDLDFKIESDHKNFFGYRNKMEFSFWWEKETNKISIALFKRGSKGKYSLDGCLLASPAINLVAKNIVDWLNSEKIEARQLKTLIIRSNIKGEVIAGLFIKEEINFKHSLELKDGLVGFSIYFSEPRSPASVPTKLISHVGSELLTESVSGLIFEYGLFSFFQVNLPIFEIALNDIQSILKNEKGELVDFYSGVGSIGFTLAPNFKKCLLIESNEEAVSCAEKNKKNNKLENCEIILSPSEKVLDSIGSGQTIVFDPPRAGLHDKIIERIREEKPKKIAYLSCNLSTQARDISLLKDLYEIKLSKLYNFFPRTPHIEGLIVLELKNE